jgi:hypothetical protein
MVKGKHAARTIAPFRTSGHNAPGYTSRQAPAPQQPRTPPVRRAAPGNGVGADYLANRAQNGFYVVPTISATEHEHGVAIRIDGYWHRVPEGVEVAFGRSEGRDIAYLHRAEHNVVILVAVRGVGVPELTGVSQDVLTDLRVNLFPPR